MSEWNLEQSYLHQHAAGARPSADGKFIFTAGGPGYNCIEKHDLVTGKCVKSKVWAHRYSVEKIAVAPNNAFIATCDNAYPEDADEKVNIWDAETLEKITALDCAPLNDDVLEKGNSFQAAVVRSISIHPNSKMIAAGIDSIYEGCKIFELDHHGRWELTEAEVDSIPIERGVDVVVFSPNGEMLACGGGRSDEVVRVYSVVNKFAVLYKMSPTDYTIEDLCFSSDNTRIYCVDFRGMLIVWNPTEGTKVEIPVNGSGQQLVAYSPYGDLLACYSGGNIEVWDAKKLKIPKFSIDVPVDDFCFSQMGPFLLTSSEDTNVNLIKIAFLESHEKRFVVLLAFVRFTESVNESKELKEFKKFEAAKNVYKDAADGKWAGDLMQCALIGGDGAKGVLGVMLSFL